MADTYRVKAEADVPIRMRDGVTTYADVYRPDAAGRFPTLLMGTPYDKSTSNSRTGSMDVFVVDQQKWGRSEPEKIIIMKS